MTYACPQCFGVNGYCCVCRGTRRLEEAQLVAAVAWAWARAGCRCAACLSAGHPPGVTPAPDPLPVAIPKPVLGHGAIPWRFDRRVEEL